MKIKLDSGAFEPTRAYPTDAGLDIRAVTGDTIPPGGAVTFHTGVHVELPPGTAGLLVSKSGLNVKDDITSTGLIDYSYSGEILVKLYNHGNKYKNIRRGDKLTQLVVIPVLCEPVEIVKELEVSGRGNNGFGSTGR